MTEPLRLYVVGMASKPRVQDATEQLLTLLDGRAEVLGVDLEARLDLAQVDADMIVVLGGDGAILAATRRLDGNPVPVLGINFGKLGFMAEARASELAQTVENVLVGRQYRITDRMLLEATVRHADGRVRGPVRGLNDAVVERWDPRTLTVHLRVDGAVATTYRGDGLIVATPTGSTAHSLAAGGPILEPGMQAFVVSPMCAHSVANRPLVLPPDSVIEMMVGPGSRRPGLAVDGQVLFDLAEGDVIEVRRSARGMRLAAAGNRSFFEVLRARFHWAGAPPYAQATEPDAESDAQGPEPPQEPV